MKQFRWRISTTIIHPASIGVVDSDHILIFKAAARQLGCSEINGHDGLGLHLALHKVKLQLARVPGECRRTD